MSEDTLFTQYIDPDELKVDVEIDTTDLTTGMAKHASLYTHYAVQATRAQRQYDRWKLALEILESQLDTQVRTAAAEEGRKTTENAIKAAIVTDAKWKACQSRVVEARQMKDLCDAAIMCFVHRKDMLLQLARDAAMERSGELRVGAMTASREQMTDALARAKVA